MFAAPKTLTFTALFLALAACQAPVGQAPMGQPSIGQPRVEAAPEMGGLAPQVMESPVMEAPAVIVAPPPTGSGRARAGIVTAGDIDDALNLPAFLRYQDRAADDLRLAKAPMGAPVLVQLLGPNGAPAPGVRVTLRRPGADAPFYDGYSGVDGRVAVFPAAMGERNLSAVELRAFQPGGSAFTVRDVATGPDWRSLSVPFAGGWAPDFLDLVFVVDATGSMADELAWLAQEVGAISRAAQAAAPGVDVRLGLMVYRAPGDPAVIRSYGFTRDPRAFARWVRSEPASGGAGGPEVVADALTAAVDLDWRRGRGERLIFQIGDEPPHVRKTATYYRAAGRAAAAGIQVFNVAASGVDDHLEFLMRQGAAITGGRYVFLTDDSGVGLAHAEPTISCYRVTRLNDLLGRILRSELSGQRVEAEPDAVIRTVGSYQSGRCLD